MKKVTINVTEDDIRNGRTGCDTCPLALAFNRTLSRDDISVTWRSWYLGGPNFQWIELPAIASHFIEQFDRHSRVEPISFEIEYDEVSQ